MSDRRDVPTGEFVPKRVLVDGSEITRYVKSAAFGGESGKRTLSLTFTNEPLPLPKRTRAKVIARILVGETWYVCEIGFSRKGKR